MQTGSEHKIELVTQSGVEARARVVRLTRDRAVVDLFGPENFLRVSEVLAKVKISIAGNVLYEGRGVVREIVSSGGDARCSISLDEGGVVLLGLDQVNSDMREGYRGFMAGWSDFRRINSQFKTTVVELYQFLTELRQWLDKTELMMDRLDSQQAREREKELVEKLRPNFLQSIGSLTGRFEELAVQVNPEDRAVHERFVRGLLHPLVLGAPFAHRTYTKPLGYAGDYEMMNMIHRRQGEGHSLFTRLVHFWLVEQPPAEAVRNRVAHLGERILTETLRVHHEGRRSKILNIGCGPSWEVQHFMRNSPLSNSADFSLMDFNEETLSYVSRRLNEVRREAGRSTGIQTIEMSVYQLLKRSMTRGDASKEQYDMLYCAGLFDYLSKTVSQQLVKMFLDMVVPGGMVLIANMEDSQPFRYNTEYLLDWNLIYRNSHDMAALVPTGFAGSSSVSIEPAGVNLFLELRK